MCICVVISLILYYSGFFFFKQKTAYEMRISDWSSDVCSPDLLQRIGVIFQDFARYHMRVGENGGAGDVEHFENRERWQEAADMGMATPFIEALPAGFDTQLGKWFRDGRELSGGQWQKIALARAFMRSRADILVLDEPTAAMDAAAEATIFRSEENTSELQSLMRTLS